MAVKKSNNHSDPVNRLVRGIILIVVSMLASITFVSFAVHHMRLQFETEYKSIADNKMNQVCDVVKMTIHGDEIVENPTEASIKYNSVLNLMLAETAANSLSDESYALFMYSEGQLTMLLSYGADTPENFAVTGQEISSWLSTDNSTTTIYGDGYESVLVPVSDSSGRCVGVFEYKLSYSKLGVLGDTLEGRILTAVIITVSCGIVIFIIQLVIPRIIKSTKKGGQHL